MEEQFFEKFNEVAKYTSVSGSPGAIALILHDPNRIYKHEYYIVIYSVSLETEEDELEVIKTLEDIFKKKITNPHRTAVFVTSKNCPEKDSPDLLIKDFFRIGFKWDNDDRIIREMQIFSADDTKGNK